MLIGYYTDPKAGTFSAGSYLEFSLAGNKDFAGREKILTYTGEPVFDSLVLALTHDYSYGDTTSTHIMRTYRLTENLQLANGSTALYNGQAFAHDALPLATNTIRYSTANGQKLRIRMDALGAEIFQLALDLDDRVATNDAFKNYFKGLALVSDQANQSIFGYTRGPVFTLYYHDTDNETTVKTYTFKHTPGKELYFNQLKNDRTSTALAPLKEIYQEIDATLTGNEAYMMTGVELLAKIKFPTLNSIKAVYPNFAVNKAVLVIHPKKGSYNQLFRLPTSIGLYKTNQTNIPGSAITYTGTAVTEIINPNVDYEDNYATYYQFEITDFIQDQLKSSFYNETALLLASPRTVSGSRTEKLVLDNNTSSNTIKLKLYLTIF